ncbi:MAG: zinc ribbon domain-containing protein [Phycisphaerales bacterium]
MPPSPADELFLRFVDSTPARCPACGFNLRGLRAPVCPECGTPLRLVVGPRQIISPGSVAVGMLLAGATIAPGVVVAVAFLQSVPDLFSRGRLRIEVDYDAAHAWVSALFFVVALAALGIWYALKGRRPWNTRPLVGFQLAATVAFLAVYALLMSAI